MAALARAPLNLSVGRLLIALCLCSQHVHKGIGEALNSSHTDSGTRVRRLPDEQRLYETIMKNYQQSVMPHIDNASYTLTVAFSLRLNQIVSLDERKQVLTTNVFIDQAWVDPGLAWDRDSFIDVRALRIPDDHVWLPDTFVYNNADGGTSGFMRGTYVQIQSNGRVLWPVPLRLRSSCKVKITYFPFDSQICTLRFGSWIYGMSQLDYVPLTDGLTVDPSTYVNNSEWELVSITMHKAMSPSGGPERLRHLGPHPHLTYVLHLKRNTFFYLFNIIVPCVMLSTLNILTFWLPPVSGEKVTLGLSVFLAFSMFMLLIAEEVPATSEAVPLIGVYLCMVMTMTSVSVMMAVVVTNLYHRGRKMRQAPRWLVITCLHWLAKPTCVLNDIQLIASTVDLVEHSQYDVSHKRQSLPFLAQNLNVNVNETADILSALCTPSGDNPSSVPTHLQNGGYVSRERHDALGSRRRETLLLEEMRSPRTPTERKGSAMSSFFSGMGGKKVTKEVHPRARNSVVTSCHFTKIPTFGDEEDDDDDNSVDDQPEEVEEVWVRRNDVSGYPSSESELNHLIDNHNEEDTVANAEEEEEEEDEEADERDTSRSLLANSAGPHPSTTNHEQLHASDDTDLGSRRLAGANPCPARAPNKCRNNPRNHHHHSRCQEGPEELSMKLDPHPISSDLQSARTMIAEWQQIATVVDRLMFVLYVVTVVTAYVIILVIVPANQPPVTSDALDSAGTDIVTRYWGG